MKMEKTVIGWLFTVIIIMGSLYGFTVKDEVDYTNNTIKIGKQEWMGENLNIRFFRNGDPIFEANSYEEWEYANIKGIPAWCYYNNNPRYGKTYGKLYNWWAVSDSRGLAPEGWHIPSDEEWNELQNYLDGIDNADEKSNFIKRWQSNGNNSNKSGSECILGGCRSHEGANLVGGAFYKIDEIGYWWSRTSYLVDNAWSRSLTYKNRNFDKTSFVKIAGLSVRLIKD